MRVVMTGADGFLGWHTGVRMRALTDHEVIPVDLANWDSLGALVGSADAVLHFAGINRASDRGVEDGNADLARELADAVRSAPSALAIVYADTIQAGNGTPYGTGKALASTILGEVASAKGSPFADVLLPNLFGEHGRPDYNSFVATFAHKVVTGEHPEVQDRELGDSGAGRALAFGPDPIDRVSLALTRWCQDAERQRHAGLAARRNVEGRFRWVL